MKSSKHLTICKFELLGFLLTYFIIVYQIKFINEIQQPIFKSIQSNEQEKQRNIQIHKVPYIL